MAKKHVGIVEQHVEKAVLGVAVLLLLAVVFKYLVGNPNTVAFDGNTQYPGQIDLAVRDKAERLAQKLQRDKEIDADRLTAPSWVDTLKDAFERGPIAVNELTSVITAAVPWGTPVQRIKVEKTRQAREGITLAKVDPSSSPKVRYLRTLAVPPQDPEAKTGDAPTDDKDALEVDVDLVIVRLTFDVARQQEIFLKDYNYEPDFAARDGTGWPGECAVPRVPPPLRGVSRQAEISPAPGGDPDARGPQAGIRGAGVR